MTTGGKNPGAGRSLRGVPTVPAAAPARPPVRRVTPPAFRARSASRSVLPLVAWPALVTLAVTLLRLVGELRGWAPEYWDRSPGGGGALLGIVWLIPLVGLWLGWRLAAQGERPGSPWQAALQPPLALLLLGGGLLLLDHMRRQSQMPPLSWQTWLGLWAVASLVAAVVGFLAWPALGRALLAYALAARVPVAALMAFAMYRSWNTHYDAPPPYFPPMGWAWRWLWTGLLPQLTVWVAITVAAGALCGVLGVLAFSLRERVRERIRLAV